MGYTFNTSDKPLWAPLNETLKGLTFGYPELKKYIEENYSDADDKKGDMALEVYILWNVITDYEDALNSDGNYPYSEEIYEALCIISLSHPEMQD